MKQSAELVVLATTKVGENQLVVHTLSKEFGRRGFIVRPGKKTSAALFMPLSILEADIVENPKSQLWSLKDVSALDALGGIREHSQAYHFAVPCRGAVPHREGRGLLRRPL